MSLELITKESLLLAAEDIDSNGILSKNIINNYWILIPDKGEYPFIELMRIALNKMELPTKELRSAEKNRNVIEKLGFKIQYYKEAIGFFQEKDVNHFAAVAGKPYRKENDQNIRDGGRLKKLVKQVNKWSKLSQISELHSKWDSRWQWSGTFKSYLWIRNYRPDADPRIYFVLGCDEFGSLYMQLGCQTSNHTRGTTQPLPKEVIKLIDEHLEISDYHPITIKSKDLALYNWDSLVRKTKEFFYFHLPIYDDLLDILASYTNGDGTSQDGKKEVNDADSLSIEDVSIPDEIRSNLRAKDDFRGANVDWEQKNRNSSVLGMNGEQTIIKYEQQKLKELELNHLVHKVEKVKDGCGYDILSFDQDENKIYIEVKTTKGGLDSPFFISKNEIDFAELHPDSFWIYRLTNFRRGSKNTKLFKIKGKELGNFKLRGVQFELSK